MNPIDRLLSTLAPYKCLNCPIEGKVLCAECTETIMQLPSICYACGKATRNYRPCPDCVGEYKPQHAWVYAEYKDLAKDYISAFKFGSKRQVAVGIAGLIGDILPYFVAAPLVTYVPTAASRRRERGFDQAELLAKELARIRKWQYAPLLVRQADVRQLGSTREQRKKQLRGVFRPTSQEMILGSHILLVDDVLTTGATIESCSKVLKKAGASYVDAVVFSRTPKK